MSEQQWPPEVEKALEAVLAGLMAETRIDARRQLAGELQDLATREEMRLRRAHRIGPVGNLPQAVNAWVGGIRRAARHVLGGRP